MHDIENKDILDEIEIPELGKLCSIISETFVKQQWLKASERKEYRYVCHSVSIIGEAEVPVILKSNRGDHEILQHFLVTNTKGPAGEVDVLAMDFLVDYQCEIHLEKELEVTIMDRKPTKPQEGKEEP